jgi:arylsulfatase A-like enzyme
MFKFISRNPNIVILGVVSCILSLSCTAAVKRPNFLFLISEDNSYHHLKLYNKAGANTPNIEALAAHGLIFNNAFSNAPVCSTARTTLATGAYGPKIGTFFHRAYKQVSLPGGLVPYSQTFKKSGYYTTNNAKTDYNLWG